jgi:hypothetical protein
VGSCGGFKSRLSLIIVRYFISNGEPEVETTSAVDEYSGEHDFCHHRPRTRGNLPGSEKLVH